MNKPLKSLRICFERTSGDHINDAEVFVEQVGSQIDIGTVPMRFGGYISLDAGVRVGLHGAPCWQYIIDGDIDQNDLKDFLFDLEAPKGYHMHFFSQGLEETSESFDFTIGNL